MKKILVALSVLGFTFALTACGGPDCKALCDKGKDCDGSTADTVTACKSLCDTMDKCASTTGCSSQWDDALSCADDNSSKICDDTTTCDSKSEAFGTCITADIAANPAHASDCGF